MRGDCAERRRAPSQQKNLNQSCGASERGDNIQFNSDYLRIFCLLWDRAAVDQGTQNHPHGSGTWLTSVSKFCQMICFHTTAVLRERFFKNPTTMSQPVIWRHSRCVWLAAHFEKWRGWATSTGPWNYIFVVQLSMILQTDTSWPEARVVSGLLWELPHFSEWWRSRLSVSADSEPAIIKRGVMTFLKCALCTWIIAAANNSFSNQLCVNWCPLR